MPTRCAPVVAEPSKGRSEMDASFDPGHFSPAFSASEKWRRAVVQWGVRATSRQTKNPFFPTS